MTTFECVRVIRHPVEVDKDGETPTAFAARCAETESHIVKLRLPKSLKGLALWVEPRLKHDGLHLWLDLLLFHDGQLPLRFAPGRDKREPPALTEELDRLAHSIEAALENSNRVWHTAAEIANAELDPADELEFLRWKSGYEAPKRSRSSRVPLVLQVITRQRHLALESPETRPEYTESEVLKVIGTPTVTDHGLQLEVRSAEPLDAAHSFRSRIGAGSVLSLRWPGKDPYPWKVLAHIAAILEVPLEFAGRGVVSTTTLEGKAFEVERCLGVNGFLARLAEILSPVEALERECCPVVVEQQ